MNWRARYIAHVNETRTAWGPAQHLYIERHDRKPIRCGWDTLQAIKNEMLGKDVCAVEFFPEAYDVVDEINRRHFYTVDLTPPISRR